jgi:hypothetical protein
MGFAVELNFMGAVGEEKLGKVQLGDEGFVVRFSMKLDKESEPKLDD